MMRRVAVAGILLAAGALVTLALAADDTWRSARDLQQAREELRLLSLDDMADPDELVRELGAIASTAERAAERLGDSPWVALWTRVPLAGSQLGGATILADAAAEAARVAHATAEELTDELATVGVDRRIDALRAAEASMEAMRRELSAIRLPSSRVLLPPITGSRDALRTDLREADESLARLTGGLGALRTVLDGPTNVLVLAANNAEMRAGGMVLSVGTTALRDGSLGPIEFIPTDGLAPDHAVGVPRDIDDLYGWLEPGREWRNTGTSPNFPAVGPVYRRLAQASGLGQADMVVQVDVVALRLLLEALGPVTVRDIPVRADRVEAALLNGLYLRYPDQPELRRSLEHEVGAAVFAAMGERDWDLGRMVRALTSATRGRHLMAWSAAPAVQQALVDAGAAGALDAHGLLVAVQNHAGGKLDWYVDVAVEVETFQAEGGERVVVQVEIANDSPAGLPAYVEGTGQGGVPPGDYRAFITAYLPAGSTTVGTTEDVLVSGPDGPMIVTALRVDVARGEVWRGSIGFTLPDDHGPIRVLPGGRARPVPITIGDQARADTDRPTIAS